jgi:MFS family permease
MDEQKSLLLVSISALLYIIGYGGVWFVLPLIAQDITKDLTLVGVLVAIPYIVSLLLDIPVGGLADNLGRKKLLRIGLLFMAILGLAFNTISSLYAFIIFMVLFGIANQTIFISARAYVMDISPKGKTSEFFGIFDAMASVGTIIGPIIAGMLVADNLPAGISSVGIFYFVMCMATLSLVLLLKEAITYNGLRSSVRDLLQKDKLILRELTEFKELRNGGAIILIMTFVLVVTDGLIWTMEPLYFTLGFQPEMLGLLMAMFVVPFVLFSVPAGFIADKIGKTRTMFIGLLLAGSFMITFGVTREPTLLFSSAFLATTGLAFVRPAVDGLLTDLAEKKHKGGIVGVWDVSEDLGYIVGPILGGIVASIYKDIGFAFIVMGGILLLMTPLVLWTSRHGEGAIDFKTTVNVK